MSQINSIGRPSFKANLEIADKIIVNSRHYEEFGLNKKFRWLKNEFSKKTKNDKYLTMRIEQPKIDGADTFFKLLFIPPMNKGVKILAQENNELFMMSRERFNLDYLMKIYRRLKKSAKLRIETIKNDKTLQNEIKNFEKKEAMETAKNEEILAKLSDHFNSPLKKSKK